MDIKDIQNLIKFVAKSGAQEVKLEMEDIKITIKTGSDHSASEGFQGVQPLPVAAPAAPAVTLPVEIAPRSPNHRNGQGNRRGSSDYH